MKDFIKRMKTIRNFVTNDEWRETLAFSCAIDNELFELIIDTILKLKNHISVRYVENIFFKIRSLSLKNIEKSNAQRDVKEKYKLYRRAFSYYVFLETLTEYSAFSDKVIKTIRLQFRDNASFFDFLSNEDRIMPSKLTKFNNDFRQQNQKIKGLDLYLLLKKWQDDQHLFYLKYFKNEKFEKKQKEFLNKYSEFEPGVSARELLVLIDLEAQPYVTLEQVTKLIVGGFSDSLKKVIGGKGYGLAILNSKLYNVPYTVIIPHSSRILDVSFLKQGKYAIRSSANIEDGSDKSFAGLFDTFLDIEKDDVVNKIYEIKNRACKKEFKKYLKDEKVDLKMPVLVQSFIDADYSGVWMGRGLSNGILEVVDGVGENLVSGLKQPQTFFVNRNECPEYWRFLIKSVRKLQNKLSMRADIEWAEKDGKLYFLQFRPMTTNIDIFSDYSKPKGPFTLSSGKTSGPVFFYDGNLANFTPNGIFVARIADPELSNYIMQSKGVIVVTGGMLCHVAIICRELGIPCISAISEELFLDLSNAKEVKMDADSCKIELG